MYKHDDRKLETKTVYILLGLLVFLGLLMGRALAGIQTDYADPNRYTFDGLSRVEKAVFLVMLDNSNAIRTKCGMATNTVAQFKDAVANKFKELK